MRQWQGLSKATQQFIVDRNLVVGPALTCQDESHVKERPHHLLLHLFYLDKLFQQFIVGAKSFLCLPSTPQCHPLLEKLPGRVLLEIRQLLSRRPSQTLFPIILCRERATKTMNKGTQGISNDFREFQAANSNQFLTTPLPEMVDTVIQKNYPNFLAFTAVLLLTLAGIVHRFS